MLRLHIIASKSGRSTAHIHLVRVLVFLPVRTFWFRSTVQKPCWWLYGVILCYTFILPNYPTKTEDYHNPFFVKSHWKTHQTSHVGNTASWPNSNMLKLWQNYSGVFLEIPGEFTLGYIGNITKRIVLICHLQQLIGGIQYFTKNGQSLRICPTFFFPFKNGQNDENSFESLLQRPKKGWEENCRQKSSLPRLKGQHLQ
jgi:hypothetical protein